MGIHTSPLAVQAAQLIAETGETWSSAREILMEENPGLSFSSLPSDEEIAHALRAHYALFDPKGHEKRLKALRLCALKWMLDLEQYQPRVKHGILNGCADRFSDIYLDITSEDPKGLEIELTDKECDFEVELGSETGLKNPPLERIYISDPLPEDFFGTTAADNPDHLRIILDVYGERKRRKQPAQLPPDEFQIAQETLPSADVDQFRELLYAKYS